MNGMTGERVGQLSAERLIAAAYSLVGVKEEGHNRGRMVELFLREVGQMPGMPWCAAFVYHAGYWSHYDHRVRRSTWPLPATASCWELGHFAQSRAALMEEPMAGDVFLVRDTDKRRFAHTGIVISIGWCKVSENEVLYGCVTIEGNSNTDGSREGNLTVLRERIFSVSRGDRFIRWTQLKIAEKAA